MQTNERNEVRGEVHTEKVPRSRKKAFRIQRLLFSILLIVFCLIGLMIPLRPTESEAEKRKLTEFPQLSWSSFWDGSFFSELETWYADTYPLRESMIELNGRFESLFGNREEQIVGDISGGDTVPDVEKDEEDFDWLYNPDGEIPPVDDPPLTEPVTDPIAPPITEEPDLGDGAPIPDAPVDPDAPAEMIESLYLIGDTAYELYYFNQDNADRYVDLVNGLADELGSDATVYSIIAPLAYGIYLDKSMQDKLNLTDEDQALIYLYSQMDDNVKKVYAYRNLLLHRNEYLYFRTDHHWTSLGAYYAYEVFCKQKGISPQKLSNLRAVEFSGFLGSLYTTAKKPAALANNPDTVIAYVPNGTNELTYYDTAGNKVSWKVISNVTSWGAGSKYGAFIGGDQPLAEIHNPNITDGSSCVVVKNSFGNCFVPYLVDHYETVYVVDFRYFPKWSQNHNNGQTFTQFVREKGIDDVIVMTNITAATSTTLLNYLDNCISE
ncbi:MAG: hypothetical protein IJW62_04510 [Clostridia bacterium]|nr:hypothetical protein [Clostridia bacterium]